MEFQYPWLSTVSVFIIALCLIGQTVSVILFNLRIRKHAQGFAPHLEKLSRMITEGLNLLHQPLGSIREQTAALGSVQENLDDRLPVLVGKVRQLDQAIGRQVDLWRYQVQQAGATIDGAVNKVSQETFKLHQATQHSPAGLTTLFQTGLQLVLSLFSTRPTRPASHSGDAEDFI